MPAKKLNLGCGTDIKNPNDGWVNLDVLPLPGVDVVHDIEKPPLPFSDELFDEIFCRDVLEHIDYAPLMRELYRILKPGGKIFIRSPHFTSKNNFIDPTHKKAFSVNTFDFFTAGNRLEKKRGFYFDYRFSRIASLKITFEKSSWFLIYNRLIEPLVNLSKHTQELYEATGFSRLFPAENVIVELIK